MRHLLGRLPSGEQGPTPSWAPIHASLVPFACGSFAGVSSWAIIYPLDVSVARLYILYVLISTCRVKTKFQQRALSGETYRGPLTILHRLLRGSLPSTLPHRGTEFVSSLWYRTRPERAQDADTRLRSYLSRIGSERSPEHHHTWNAMDLCRCHFRLDRQSNTISQRFGVVHHLKFQRALETSVRASAIFQCTLGFVS